MSVFVKANEHYNFIKDLLNILVEFTPKQEELLNFLFVSAYEHGHKHAHQELFERKTQLCLTDLRKQLKHANKQLQNQNRS